MTTYVDIVAHILRSNDLPTGTTELTQQSAAATCVPLGDRQFNLMFVLTRLDKYAGFKMLATGALIGDGGANGINVTTVTPVAEKCE